jgi:hypothetical protein
LKAPFSAATRSIATKGEGDFDKIHFDIVGLKAHDQKNRQYLTRYTRFNAINEARDMINEPDQSPPRNMAQPRATLRRRPI